jgi:hypothetical protein
MSERPTPETDCESGFFDMETAVGAAFARRLERERNEAREKIKQQKLEIVRLNGATSHAGGTPLKIALRERDEAREQNAKLREIAERAIEEMESGDPVGTSDVYRAELNQLKEGAK